MSYRVPIHGTQSTPVNLLENPVPDLPVQSCRKMAVGKAGGLPFPSRPQVGTGPSKAVDFPCDNPRAPVIEAQTPFRGGRQFNSVLWVRRGKDTLAMGNISGAMVFQSCIPVAIGIAFTKWDLTTSANFPALISGFIALTSTAIVFSSQKILHRLSPKVLVLGFLFWLLFVLYVIFYAI